MQKVKLFQGCQPSRIDHETHGFHFVLTVSQQERYFSQVFLKSHYYRLNSHCFQLWQLVYSEVSGKKTTMHQQYALLHDIKVCILKMLNYTILRFFRILLDGYWKVSVLHVLNGWQHKFYFSAETKVLSQSKIQ